MRSARASAQSLVLAATFALLAGCGQVTASQQASSLVSATSTATTNARQPTPAATVPAQTVQPPTEPSGARCAARPVLADVYHPDRLHVIRPCVTVTGVVASVRREADGDWHFNIELPAAEQGLLDPANDRYEHGELVAEIVPADEVGCGPVGAPARVPASAYRGPSYNYGTCSGLDLGPPAVGARVAVTGPYVLDADHLWREVHPAERIEVLR